MAKKPKLKANKFYLYTLAETCIRDGIISGWNRAHKHSRKPPLDLIFQKQLEAVMLNLSEEFDFRLGI